MRKTLMATVAVAAVVGFTSLAAAQGTMDSGKGAAKPAGAAEEQKAPGGAMAPQQGTKAPQSAQGADQGAKPGAKPEQRMGQEPKNETTPQRGAEENRGTTQERGAQQEQKTKQQGATEERGTTQRGAKEDSGKSGVNASEQGANPTQGAHNASRGASVQLSQNQRGQIQSIIGKGGGARARTDVHFNVAVGAIVPRDVHIEVLPEDVVAVVPQYEGFDYVVVGDQILIVDPDSLAIVAVIET